MRLNERVRIITDASMMEELYAYNAIYEHALKQLIQSDLKNSHVRDFPYYKITNEIAAASKPILVKQALIIKHGGSLSKGFHCSWHPDSFDRCQELLHLYPGYKFSTDEIFCTLSLLPSQRILLKTHDILQIDMIEYRNGWYASMELETKSFALIRKHLSVNANCVYNEV